MHLSLILLVTMCSILNSSKLNINTKKMSRIRFLCVMNSPDYSHVKGLKQHKFSVAPMMDYTDCHQHYFHRLLSKESILYTEMVCATTAIHGDPERHLKGYLELVDEIDRHKTVLQLGGSCPNNMGAAAKIATKYGFTEININSGCPSDRVAGSGNFGASLMLTPQIVADIATSISHQTGYPTTVKCRIGVDNNDSYEELCNYIHTINTKGNVNHFIVHARKAILGGKFSPADNRKIPPLKYDYVYKLIHDFPHIGFTINGGIETYEAIDNHFQNQVHGVMIGRSVVGVPYYWSQIDSKIYQSNDPGLTRRQILEKYAEYCIMREKEDFRSRRAVIKPILNLFHGQMNGKLFRNQIDQLLIQDSSKNKAKLSSIPKAARSKRVRKNNNHTKSELSSDSCVANTPCTSTVLVEAKEEDIQEQEVVVDKSIYTQKLYNLYAGEILLKASECLPDTVLDSIMI